MKSHLFMYLQLDHVSPRSASIVEIKGINQSIGRTSLLIYNYCHANCRWYLTIIHCFLKLRLQISSICVTTFFFLCREKEWKTSCQLPVLNLAIYYVQQVLTILNASLISKVLVYVITFTYR